MTNAQYLEMRFPKLPWREPVQVRLYDSARAHYACRFCICARGLKGHDIPGLPIDPEVVVAHIAREHPP